MLAAAVRVCLVYDCLFPYTVGGGERWYRSLAEALAGAGHEVTYLTLRQWQPGEEPDIPGVEVIAVGPRMQLYVKGRRRIAPPLVFGAGVLWHLLRHGRSYEIVHSSAFPYFSLLAAALLRPLGRYALIVDWLEVWSADYWREYLGRAGWIGIAVQRRCARVPQSAFCLSELHAARLRDEGLRGEVTVLKGLYSGSLEPEQPLTPEPCAVFAGRLIPEKNALSVVAAVTLAAEQVPGLHGIIFGDGPQRDAVLASIASLEQPALVSAPGFVAAEEVREAIRRACCLVLPSRREGYGLVVLEASAVGTPSIVVREADNAAVELIEEGVNGLIAPSAAPRDLAAAIVAVVDAGASMRASTSAWFARNAERLSLQRSLEQVLEAYESVSARA
jgi:glycosyltransferase involved in cell wall biosynthesis